MAQATCLDGLENDKGSRSHGKEQLPGPNKLKVKNMRLPVPARPFGLGKLVQIASASVGALSSLLRMKGPVS